MIAVIKSGTALRSSFYYNENKVKDGVALLLDAVNFPVNVAETTEHFRLNLLQRFADLNPNVKRPSMHISLNFAPGEQISEAALRQITQEYMEAIGFGAQPYLLYQHMDAAHPHVHIVTLRVRPDGSTIDTFNIGRKLSRPAEQAIEERYDLVRSADHKQELFQLRPIDVGIAAYGKTPTKRAIGNVLSAVLDQYKYASLPELNAVLNLYNVSAERSSTGSRTYNSGGLVYRVLDAEGKPVGARVKASAFYNKPTLAYLEQRFVIGKSERSKHAARIKNRIDLTFVGGQKPTLNALSATLKKDGIATVFRYSEGGQLYGITYVDHKNKCVFNGSSLGPTYSAKAISERCAATLAPQKRGAMEVPSLPSDQRRPGSNAPDHTSHYAFTGASEHSEKSLLEELTQAENTGNYMPYELSGKKKDKKKRRKINH